MAAKPLRLRHPLCSDIPLWQRHTPMEATYSYGSGIPLRQRLTPMAATYPYGSDIPLWQRLIPVRLTPGAGGEGTAAEMQAMAGTSGDADVDGAEWGGGSRRPPREDPMAARFLYSPPEAATFPYGIDIFLWQLHTAMAAKPPYGKDMPSRSDLPQAQEAQEAEETAVQAAAEIQAMAGIRNDGAELDLEAWKAWDMEQKEAGGG